MGYLRTRAEPDLALSGRELLLNLQRQLGLPGSGSEFLRRCLAYSGYAQERIFLSAVAIGEVSYIDLLGRVLASQEPPTAVASQANLPGIDTHESVAATVLQVVADNREGLLSDITQLLAASRVSLMGASGRVSNSSEHAIITLEAELHDGRQLLEVISLITLLKGVADVTRVSAPER